MLFLLSFSYFLDTVSTVNIWSSFLYSSSDQCSDFQRLSPSLVVWVKTPAKCPHWGRLVCLFMCLPSRGPHSVLFCLTAICSLKKPGYLYRGVFVCTVCCHILCSSESSDQEADPDPVGLVGFPKALSSRMHTVSDCLLFGEASSHWWPTSNSLEVANSDIVVF